MTRYWPALLVYSALLLLPFLLSQTLAHLAGWDARPWLDDMSSGLAMVGFAAVVVEFVLLGRFKPLSWTLGSDWLMQAHQLFARTAAAMLLLHPFLYSLWGARGQHGDLNFATALRANADNWGIITGFVAWVALGFLVLMALYRHTQAYERWRRWHVLLALAVLVLGLHHTWAVGRYSQLTPVWVLWCVLVGIAVLSVLWVYGVRPALQRGQPYTVTQVRGVAERIWELVLQPSKRKAMRFHAGQFAWLRMHHEPPHHDHPFSISSAPRADGQVHMLIKEAGDFTHALGRLAGHTAYLDGPYGHFTLPTDNRPLVLLAGGIGVAPFVGLLQACVHQGCTRPIRLVYADKHSGQMVDIATLANTHTLQNYVCLSVVEQASAPNHQQAASCNGATQYEAPAHMGRLDTAGLSSILAHPQIAPLVAEAHFMLCGPNGMMDQAETTLMAAGVPEQRIHAEHFQYDFKGQSPLARKARRYWLTTSAGLVAGIILVVLATRL
jgi:predicted ferric reductase